MRSPRCRSASMRVQDQESVVTASVLEFDCTFASTCAFIEEDPGVDKDIAIFEAPGMDKRVVSGAGVGYGDGDEDEDESFTLDADDNRDSESGGGDVRMTGSSGNRLELRRMRSGGIVSRLCLKTYFAIAEAKMAG